MANRLSLAVIFAVIGTFVLTSCTTLHAPPPESMGSVCQSSAAEASQAEREIRIYHDVTASMRGFLLAGKEPPYYSFVDAVESAARTLRNDHVSFFQFGTKIEPLNRSDRKELKTYQTRPGYEDNDYGIVFDEAASKPGLTLIVTDLFQSDNDVPGVATKIQADFFSPSKTLAKTQPRITPEGNAIAVLGVKLPFAGPIYDMGRSRGSIPNFKGSRPIYVLAVGEKGEVSQYMRQLRSTLANSQLDADTNVLLLSPFLVSCLPVIDVPMVKSGDWKKLTASSAGGVSVSNMDVVDELVSEQRHPLVKQFLVSEGPDPAHLSVAVPVVPLAFLPPFEGSLTVSYATEKVSKESPAAFQPAPEAADAFHFDPPVIGNAEGASKTFGSNPRLLRIEGNLSPQKLMAGPIYRFSVSVELDRDKVVEPSWVSEWNFSPPKQDGSKTENLSTFFFTLRGQMISRVTPVMLRAYFYVKKR